MPPSTADDEPEHTLKGSTPADADASASAQPPQPNSVDHQNEPAEPKDDDADKDERKHKKKHKHSSRDRSRSRSRDRHKDRKRSKRSSRSRSRDRDRDSSRDRDRRRSHRSRSRDRDDGHHKSDRSNDRSGRDRYDDRNDDRRGRDRYDDRRGSDHYRGGGGGGGGGYRGDGGGGGGRGYDRDRGGGGGYDRYDDRSRHSRKSTGSDGPSQIWDGFRWIPKGGLNTDVQAEVDRKAADGSAFNMQQSAAHRKARRLYVGRLPVGISDADLCAALNVLMARQGLVPPAPDGSSQPVENTILSCWISSDKKFAFAEFKTVDEATVGLLLDGAIMPSGEALRVARPNDYVIPPNTAAGSDVPTPALLAAVLGGVAGAAAANARGMGMGAAGVLGMLPVMQAPQMMPPMVVHAAPPSVSAVNIGTASECLVFRNMLSASGGEDLTEEDYGDVEEDLGDEARKIGTVVKILAPRPGSLPESNVGLVYCLMGTQGEASAVQVKMHGRFFGGMPVLCTFVAPTEFPDEGEKEAAAAGADADADVD